MDLKQTPIAGDGKAFEDADGTMHILDVLTNQGSGPDTVFITVANPERTRNVFFVMRTDGVLRRTAASGASAAVGFGFVLPEQTARMYIFQYTTLYSVNLKAESC